ncbi:MAG: tetratricopeptide repeat protein, partial [Bacteroidota bacterium]
VPLLQECRELLGAADPSRLEANCLTQLGYALSEGGALEAGLEVELQALEVERALAGTDSTQGISTMYNNIATSYYTLGEFEKADSLYRRALAIDEHRLPDHHSTLAKAYGSLGSTNSVLGRYDEAVEFYRKAVEVLARGDTTAQYVTNVLYSLANTELAMGDFDAAQRTFDRLLAGRRLLLGPDHPNTLMTEGAYGGLMFEQGKIQEAKAWFEDVLQRKAEVFGTAHPRYANSMSRLALVELAAGEPSAALRHAREAQQTWSEVLPDHYVHGRIWTILGDILAATDQTEDAIDAYRTGLGYLQPTLPERHMLVADAQLGLARALQTAGTAPAEADSLEQAGRATLIDLHGLEHPRTRRMLRGT